MGYPQIKSEIMTMPLVLDQIMFIQCRRFILGHEANCFHKGAEKGNVRNE